MSQLLGAMVDPPTPLGTLEEWESYLADLRKMGDFKPKGATGTRSGTDDRPQTVRGETHLIAASAAP